MPTSGPAAMPSAHDHAQSLAHDRPWWVVGCVLGGPGAQTASDPATPGLGCPQAPQPSTPSHEATTWTSAPRSSLPNFLTDDTPSTQPPEVAFRLVASPPASPQLPDPGGPRWQEETAILQPRRHSAGLPARPGALFLFFSSSIYPSSAGGLTSLTQNSSSPGGLLDTPQSTGQRAECRTRVSWSAFPQTREPGVPGTHGPLGLSAR